MDNILFKELKTLRKYFLVVSDWDTVCPPVEKRSLIGMGGHSYVASKYIQKYYGGAVVYSYFNFLNGFKLNNEIMRFWNRFDNGFEVDLTSCEVSGNGFYPVALGAVLNKETEDYLKRYYDIYKKFEERVNLVRRYDLEQFIPPKTSYCYSGIHYTGKSLQIKPCPFWTRIDNFQKHADNGYCEFLECGDFSGGDRETLLLWDQCKECGIGEDDPDLNEERFWE